MPVWDELSYYAGRLTAAEFSPFMFYITSIFYWLLKSFGLSLLTVASYMSAVYGAMIVIPAFLLGRELSNKYGGLLAATLIGTAPQILIRTFGSSYDTDQLALFFIVLTLYFGFYAMRKKTVGSACLALLGFSAFMLAWGMFTYSLIIVATSIVAYFILNTLVSKRKEKIKPSFNEKLKLSLKEFKGQIAILVAIFFGLIIIGFIIGADPISSFFAIIGFALKAEAWIVNISIAELQPFSIFSSQGWIMAMGRFMIGDNIIDTLILLTFFALIAFGLYGSYKKDLKILSILLTLFLIGIYTTFRGIRFTQFSSALFIILIGAGFGYFVNYCKKEEFLKIFSFGLGLCLAFFALGLGLQVGQGLGPDINSNWDSAWEWLKTNTAELSLVGTWWDPGHMIAGTAERRNIADGAHCTSCMYTINDRITDLGKIMATNDENESLQLIKKYQGTSPKVYWIASDDLIGKFQWLQYFGTGCDARVEQRCPLYYMLSQQSVSYTVTGEIGIRNYGNVIILSGIFPIPIFIQGKNAALFDEMLFYSNEQIQQLKINEINQTQLIESLKPLEQQLNIKFTNQTVPLTIWIPQHYSYIVLIPQNLRNNVFTKMFFLEGQGLEHFKQVFRNEQVKIYEIIF